jgi:hypothetical protein
VAAEACLGEEWACPVVVVEGKTYLSSKTRTMDRQLMQKPDATRFRRLPLQLRRRLNSGGWRVDNWLTQPTFQQSKDMHDTSTHLAVFSVEILVQSTRK